MSAVLSYHPEPKILFDLNHKTQPTIFTPDQIKSVGGRTVRILAWYDKEWDFPPNGWRRRVSGTTTVMIFGLKNYQDMRFIIKF